MRIFRIRELLGSSLWFIPLVLLIVTVGLWSVTGAIDRNTDTTAWPLVYQGSPDGAQEILSAAVTSIISFTAVVFSITILSLQLASQQFSPRVLRHFMRDRHTQVTLGLFVSTLVFTLLVLREVRVEEGLQAAYVPRLSVVVALLLLGATLAAFVAYLHHTAQSIRVVNIIEAIATETHAAIDRSMPDEPGPARRGDRPALASPLQLVVAPSSGVVLAVSYTQLVGIARTGDALVEVVVVPGDFVSAGSPVFAVRARAALDAEEVLSTLALGTERTLRQDPAFGFRQIVDIAVRALSPGVNDPTTAVQCLDALHDLLRHVATKPPLSGELRDEEGVVRVVVRSATWEGFLSLALEEIRRHGVAQPQVARRMHALLDDLLRVVPPTRRPALREQRGRLIGAAALAYSASPHDLAFATCADRQGIGTTDGLTTA